MGYSHQLLGAMDAEPANGEPRYPARSTVPQLLNALEWVASGRRLCGNSIAIVLSPAMCVRMRCAMPVCERPAKSKPSDWHSPGPECALGFELTAQ
jgi:hypothetical protein